MKHVLILTYAIVSFSAAFTIPKGSHHLGQIDDAAKKAAQNKQPIAFVITAKKMAAT